MSNRNPSGIKVAFALMIVTLVPAGPDWSLTLQRLEAKAKLSNKRPISLMVGLSKCECKNLQELALPSTVVDLGWLKGKKHLEKLRVAASGVRILRGLPDSLLELDISDTKIDSLKYLPRTLVSLNIKGTKIRKLRKKLPPKLEILKVSGIEAGELKNLPASLKELDLENVKAQDLSVLPSGLEELYLTGVGFDTLNGLPASLVTLTLRATRISSLKTVLRSLSNLAQLTLIENDVRFDVGDLPDRLSALTIDQSSGPADLSALKYLEWLADFRDSYSVGFPASLESLTLNATRLHDLPELKSLRILKLIDAKFSPAARLPADLGDLTLASYRGPELGKLPSRLSNFSIEALMLSKLPGVPAGLEALRIIGAKVVDFGNAPKNLKTLVISETQMDKVAGLKERFPALQQLAIYNSGSLKEVGPLPAGLKKLNLAQTGVRQLPNLGTVLEELNISGTGIRLPSLAVLPRSLKVLTVSEGQVDSWEGFPPALESLRFEGRIGGRDGDKR